MLHAIVMLVKENELNTADCHPPWLKMALKLVAKSSVLFGFMTLKMNVVHSVVKHMKEFMCSSDHLFCVFSDG
jgi:hypothetical protein